MKLQLLFPELLLLLVPLLFLYFWRGRQRGWPSVIVRLVLLVGLTALAAMPLIPLGGKGADLVIVADLSRSMPGEARARITEIIKLIEERREAGDRVGVVTFGRDPRIERLPEEHTKFGVFSQQLDADGSNIGGAVALALNLIPRERPGRVLILSDGESNGAPPLPAAHEAAARGVSVDYRLFSRGEAADLAVESLDVPTVVEEREPFQFTAWVRTDRTVEGTAVLYRDDVEISRQDGKFSPGVTRLTFRDVVDVSGLARYRLELKAVSDRVPENNVGLGVINVQMPATVLLVNGTGEPDNLSRALEAGKLRVRIVTPQQMPPDLAGLAPFRAVILENVPANDIGPARMIALTHYISELGGGLLLTGGQSSFGVGGYFRSVLDPYLPVSMELKQEHRKLSLALVCVLDRSGSMAAPVGKGKTKMDLANQGVIAAIETLSSFDEVGVIAVDSAAHIIQPLTTAANKSEICARVARIQSMGGGIFVYTGLNAGGRVLDASTKGTRHIVLFSDAADSEEPGDYKRLLADFRRANITVSVIGLGSDKDVDANLLKDIAARGDGRIQFTTDPDELPRMFAQEAITVSRSSFVSDPTPCQTLGDLVLLGELPTAKFPPIDGFNLTYLRAEATAGVVTEDEYKAPVVAFWHRGLGRVAALTTEAHGKYSKTFNEWQGFSGFAIGLGRWILGGEPPREAQATISRDGGEGVVRVELDPERKKSAGEDIRTASALVIAPGDEPAQRLHLAWVGEDTLEARFPMRRTGAYLGAVEIGAGKVLRLPPLTLPYSPEFEPRTDAAEGRKLLSEMSKLTGGVERTAWDGIFTATTLKGREIRDLILPLALAVMLLHVLEIAGRRLGFFAALSGMHVRIRLPRFALTRRAKQPVQQPAPVSASTPEPTPAATAQPEKATPPEKKPRAVGDAMSRAKEKARTRVDR